MAEEQLDPSADEEVAMNKPMIVLTEQDALNIFKNYMEQHESGGEIFSITDSFPDGCNPYGAPRHGCWYVLCSAQAHNICSSRFVAISKATGEVVYDASANDEG